MRFIFISILLLNYVYADLQSSITSNAQLACYLKNPTNGLSASDYSPIVSGQTLRQSIESTHTSIQSDATCDNWALNPYVNVDTETYQVVADMDCAINSEELLVGENTVTYYWTVVNQYALDIDCQASCEVPRDSNGNIYDFTPYISETDCTVPNLQQLVLAEDPNSLYTIVDAQYLTCTTNINLTGCYYNKTINFDENSTDTNSTNIDENTTTTTQILDTSSIVESINNIKDLHDGELEEDASFLDTFSTYFDDLNQSVKIIEDNIEELVNFINGDGGFTPQFQNYNSCTIFFPLYNKSISVDMCKYSSILRPFFTFILTTSVLILLIRLHFYLFSKVYKSV